ncbi:MAG: hypothetical protein Gyms2KO_34580 [Gymnodinialimonas sp.]
MVIVPSASATKITDRAFEAPAASSAACSDPSPVALKFVTIKVSAKAGAVRHSAVAALAERREKSVMEIPWSNCVHPQR